MIAVVFCAILAMDQPGPISTVDPAFPPHAVGGGTVIAALDVSGGSVNRVTLLEGQEPFASCARSALASWKFAQATEPARVTVVVFFRHPNGTSIGPSVRRVPPPRRGSADGPYPLSVAEPAYPPQGVGQGSVVLGLDLTAAGGIDKIEAVRQLGVCTDAGIQAVRQWRFTPARDASGKAVPSKAYVVFVFRPLVL